MKRLITIVALAGMMLTTASALAQGTTPMTPEQHAKHMEQMDGYMKQLQAHVKEMQAQMDKIHQTKDPQERERLIHEHMKSMQEGMQMIHKLSGGTLEQRVAAMEMMMDQVLKQQRATIEQRGFKQKSAVEFERK